MLTEFGPRYPRQYPWKRLKSVAGPEFARLSTGAPITRGNSGNGVLLTRENRAAREQKSRNGKGVRRGREHLSKPAFAPHTRGRSTLAALRFVHNHLGRRSTTADSSCGELAHFELRAHFLDFGLLLVAARSKLRNPCAEVRSCSWSQRENRVSDRKNGVCCKRVIDHKIPALASALSQG